MHQLKGTAHDQQSHHEVHDASDDDDDDDDDSTVIAELSRPYCSALHASWQHYNSRLIVASDETLTEILIRFNQINPIYVLNCRAFC